MARRDSRSAKRRRRGGRRPRWEATMGCHWRRGIQDEWRLCKMLMWRSRLGLFTRSLGTRNRDSCMEWEALRRLCRVHHGILGNSSPPVLQNLVGKRKTNFNVFSAILFGVLNHIIEEQVPSSIPNISFSTFTISTKRLLTFAFLVI
jgi:hypothetical protein